MRVIVFFFILLFFSFIYSHKHHNTEYEENWWETLIEFENHNDEKFTGEFLYESWNLSGNLASFLKISKIKSITLPVVINILFSGFGGYGNQLLSLSEEQFEPWFGHIDHRVPHLIIPIGEEQTTTLLNPTEDSKIFYGFHLNIIKLSPLFNTLLEDQIIWNIRPEIPEYRANNTGMTGDEILIEFEHVEKDTNKTERFYVDADHVSSFLQATASGLGLENCYNLFVMNPTSPVDENQVYGYRSGFSQAEIDELRYVWGNKMEDEESLYELLDTDLVPCDSEPAPIPNILRPKFSDNRVNIIDYTKKSEEFAEWFIEQQKKAFKTALLSNFRDDPSLLFSFSRSESKTVIELAEKIINQGNEMEKDYLFRVLLGDDELTEDCVVDNWITTGRTFFMDLTAGPFNWGPLITSDGARTHQTMPKVPKYYDVEHQNVEDHASDLTDMVAKKYKDIGQLYSIKCSGNEITTDKQLCEELKKELHTWEERFNTIKYSIKNQFTGSEEEGEDADWVMDSFLSRLSASISQSIHKVLVPGSPLYKTPYSERIKYHFYIITSHKTYNPRGIDGFDYEMFKYQISQLKYPNQQVDFVFHQLNMADSIEIATAFYSSKRSVLLPTLSTDGVYSSNIVHYIDSLNLRDSMKTIREINTKSIHSNIGVRNIPILLFSLDESYPILVDKYYAAKALSDMVIIVQNSQEIYPSRLSCNSNPIYLNLRNPLKSALAATSILVGGLVPSHISYSEAHQCATQEWEWSVGDNPHSHTSYETEFTRIQIDISRRNMLIHEMKETIDIVNYGVNILRDIIIDDTNKEMLTIIKLNELSILFSQILNQWKLSCGSVAALDFETAMQHVLHADDIANEFLDLVIDTNLYMSAYQCIPHAIVDVDTESQIILIIPILFIIFDIVLFIVVFLFRGKKKIKTKIN